jgi:hypothetical protein
MCWNREVSWATGLSATALSAYLLKTGTANDIPVALVSFAIALMQFAEALMWDKVRIGGHLGVLALFLQPLALGVGLGWLHGSYAAMLGFVVLWGILALPTLIPMLQRTEWPAEPGCHGHLQWSFLEPMLSSPFAILYWVTMLGGWLFLKGGEGPGYVAMAIITLAITRAFFPGEWGSLWCFLANALPLGRILRA